MQKKTASDGMVTAGDVMQAIEELKRGDRDQIMRRLFQTDKYFAAYIEGIAAHLTNPKPEIEDSIDAMMDAVKRILVIVRAMEISHYRMWRDWLPPTSPLARLMNRDPKDNEGGSK